MANHYANIAFSAPAAERQRRAGSYAAYRARMAPDDDTPHRLEDRETEFIAAADSFFLATVTPDGWPYIQHRGGPAGFVHILDPHTIALADLPGNKQYVTLGNIDENPRAALFFVDYPTRRRLKLYGRVRAIEADADPDLAERLLDTALGPIRGPAERSILITVEGHDWNCSRHITPRFDIDQLDRLLLEQRDTWAADRAELQRRIDRLTVENNDLRARLEGSRATAAE